MRELNSVWTTIAHKLLFVLSSHHSLGRFAFTVGLMPVKFPFPALRPWHVPTLLAMLLSAGGGHAGAGTGQIGRCGSSLTTHLSSVMSGYLCGLLFVKGALPVDAVTLDTSSAFP